MLTIYLSVDNKMFVYKNYYSCIHQEKFKLNQAMFPGKRC